MSAIDLEAIERQAPSNPNGEPSRITAPGAEEGTRANLGNQANVAETPAKQDGTVEKEKTPKLIVAIHGIGDQYRYATIQSVARRVASFYGPPVGIPLGNFHPKGGGSRALPFEGQPNVWLGEVYWADIPRLANKDKDTLEETKAWAETVVQRVRALDQKKQIAVTGDANARTSVDYAKTSAVVAGMIDTIATLENLTFLAAKAGLMEFNLRDLLDAYLGDVQIVAEFADYGGKIFDNFRTTMRDLAKSVPANAEIHLVAHSEGTVVTFKGLLEAFRDSSAADNAWVMQVKSLMTIGSPIDKHVVMWPPLWDGLAAPSARRPAGQPIVWWNYYDFGDPVGFELDTTRQWLIREGWIVADPNQRKPDGTEVPAPAGQQSYFDFPEKNEVGFTRYPFPGKAHNDYWDDKKLFDFHLKEAVKLERDKAAPQPGTRWWYSGLSWVLPYLLAFCVLAGGTYLAFRNIGNALGVTRENAVLAGNVLGMTCFLAGVTIAARLPRLAPVGRAYIWPLITFPLGAWAFCRWLDGDTAQRLGRALGRPGVPDAYHAVILSGLVIAVVAGLVSRWWPRGGMWPLMLTSGGFVGWLVYRLFHAQKLPNGPELPIPPKDPDLWPVVLSVAAFLYLWWLAAQLFDLVFVWHQYIRSNRANEFVRSIHPVLHRKTS